MVGGMAAEQVSDEQQTRKVRQRWVHLAMDGNLNGLPTKILRVNDSSLVTKLGVLARHKLLIEDKDDWVNSEVKSTDNRLHKESNPPTAQ